MPHSAARGERMREFLAGWAAALGALRVAPDDVEGSIDRVLLGGEIRHRLELLARDERMLAEGGAAAALRGRHRGNARRPALHEAGRRRGDGGEPGRSGRRGGGCAGGPRVRSGLGGWSGRGGAAGPDAGHRTAGRAGSLPPTEVRWAPGTGHYAGYDPLFTWWAKQPFEEVDDALGRYVSALRAKVVGWPEDGEEPVVGDPIGADGMAADLAREMIPYTPGELIAIADREFRLVRGTDARGVARPGLRRRLEGGPWST